VKVCAHPALRPALLVALVCGTLLADDSPNPAVDSAAAGRIREGWDCFVLGEYSKAAAVFHDVVQQTRKGSEPHLSALYGLATTWDLRQSGKDTEKAATLYASLIQQNPRSDWAAWSQLALARAKYLTPTGKEPNRQEVVASYQRVIDSFPNHPAAQEAFIYQQALLIATLQKDEADRCVAALGRYVEGDSLYRSTAFGLLAQCHAILGQPERQLAAEIRAVETLGSNASNPTLDKAVHYWRIATIAEFEVGDFAAARKYYRLLLAEYPTDQRAFAAEKALARMDEFERKAREARP
jgi:tetratricopeptide (TPR) repeat protein